MGSCFSLYKASSALCKLIMAHVKAPMFLGPLSICTMLNKCLKAKITAHGLVAQECRIFFELKISLQSVHFLVENFLKIIMQYIIIQVYTKLYERVKKFNLLSVLSHNLINYSVTHTLGYCEMTALSGMINFCLALSLFCYFLIFIKIFKKRGGGGGGRNFPQSCNVFREHGSCIFCTPVLV